MMIDEFWYWFPISAVVATYIVVVILLGVELLIEAFFGGKDDKHRHN